MDRGTECFMRGHFRFLTMRALLESIKGEGIALMSKLHHRGKEN